MEVRNGNGARRGRCMGQRQKVVEGRAWGGEVRKREIGVVGKIERGAGKEQGVEIGRAHV